VPPVSRINETAPLARFRFGDSAGFIPIASPAQKIEASPISSAGPPWISMLFGFGEEIVFSLPFYGPPYEGRAQYLSFQSPPCYFATIKEITVFLR
jgi:hypothetical protein